MLNLSDIKNRIETGLEHLALPVLAASAFTSLPQPADAAHVAAARFFSPEVASVSMPSRPIEDAAFHSLLSTTTTMQKLSSGAAAGPERAISESSGESDNMVAYSVRSPHELGVATAHFGAAAAKEPSGFLSFFASLSELPIVDLIRHGENFCLYSSSDPSAFKVNFYLRDYARITLQHGDGIASPIRTLEVRSDPFQSNAGLRVTLRLW